MRVRTLGYASIIKRFKHKQFLPKGKSFHFATRRQTLNGCQIRLLIVHETTSCSHAFWIVENRFQFLRSTQKQPAGFCHWSSKLNNHFNIYNRNVLAKDRHHDGERSTYLWKKVEKKRLQYQSFTGNPLPKGLHEGRLKRVVLDIQLTVY